MVIIAEIMSPGFLALVSVANSRVFMKEVMNPKKTHEDNSSFISCGNFAIIRMQIIAIVTTVWVIPMSV